MLISPRLAFKESIARIESTKARKLLIRDEICPTDSSGSFFKWRRAVDVYQIELCPLHGQVVIER